MKRIAGALFVVAALTLSMMPARAAANVVVAHPGAKETNSFATPIVYLSKSASARFVNADPLGHPGHDVVSHKTRSNGKPWFDSALIPFGVTEIRGLDTTPIGEYTFKCSAHPAMVGTARVVA
ncbi:MAG TPA: hypothetical protein VM600_02965 [Actinomycetota bacterium]|nr:hypothetical protein [Actinomycetota bacterium]